MDSTEAFKRTMYLATGNSSVQGCEDALQYCDFLSSHGTRLHCPETCGCASPTSGLVLRGTSDGCPTVCRTSEHYKDTLMSEQCMDWSLERLQAAAGWRRLFYSWRTFMVDYLQTDQSYSKRTGKDRLSFTVWSEDALAKLDCGGMLERVSNFTKTLSNEYICKSGLFAFCPKTCGCTNATAQGAWRAMCPASCSSKSHQ